MFIPKQPLTSLLTTPLTRRYSVYFLRGTDPRKLTAPQQQQLSQFIKKDPLQPSFIIYNHTETIRKVKKFKSSLPWINIHYAMKANPIAALVKDVIATGAGLDCASRNQIQEAVSFGLRRNHIIYSNPVKDEEDLKWAGKNQIVITTADSFSELKKIKQYAPNMKILWRLAVKEDAKDKLSTNFSVKFGDDLYNDQDIHNRMKAIKEMDIKLHGIHFHCGSGKDGSSGFKKGIDQARACMKIGREYGHPMDHLDVGGGFPAGELHQSTIKTLGQTKNDPLGYKMMAQPGRHLCALSCYIMVRVTGIRYKSGLKCFHINDSLYHAFNCVLMDAVSFGNVPDLFYGKIQKHQHSQLVPSDMQQAQLFGMTCDGLDIVARQIMMPKGVQVGDWLCFGGMGAYTYGPRSRFNGMRSLVNVCEWQGDIQGVSKEDEIRHQQLLKEEEKVENDKKSKGQGQQDGKKN